MAHYKGLCIVKTEFELFIYFTLNVVTEYLLKMFTLVFLGCGTLFLLEQNEAGLVCIKR